MKTARFNLLCVLSLSVLALWAAAPAGADEGGAASAQFEFEINANLLGEAFALAPADSATAAGDRSRLFRIAEAGKLSVQDLGSSPPASAQTTTSSSGKGGFGRWLKRHWWAPTLVGVAVGVLVLEPFDDDNPDDPR